MLFRGREGIAMTLSMAAATLVFLPFVINRKAKEVSDGGPRQVASGCKDRKGMHRVVPPAGSAPAGPPAGD